MATVGVMVDDLSLTMLLLVTLISLLVQIYSWAYLHDEPRPSLGRYYAYHSLFAFSMLGPRAVADLSCRCSSSGSWSASARTC